MVGDSHWPYGFVGEVNVVIAQLISNIKIKQKLILNKCCHLPYYISKVILNFVNTLKLTLSWHSVTHKLSLYVCSSH